ncbi:MAG: RHS repeat-associated core domain-containing protein, partial [Blastocatellia bacterium]
QSFAYDKNSNLIRFTDRRGVITAYEYDALNFRTSTTIRESDSLGAPASRIETRTPDLAGNATSITGLHGRADLTYDGLHRLKSRAWNAGATTWTETILARDGAGNVLRMADRNGHVTTMEYNDGLNRLTLRHGQVGPRTSWTYADDGAGTVTMSTTRGLQVIGKTDALGRPISRQVILPGSVSYLTAYRYTGRDVEITDPRGTVTRQKRSAHGDTGDIEINGASPAYKTVMRYSAWGGMRLYTDARLRDRTYTLDPLNRAWQVRWSGNHVEQFIWDGADNQTAYTDRRAITTTRTYDHLNRPLLTSVAGQVVQQLVYDDPARRHTVRDARGYAAAPQYGTTYQYDELRRLTQVTNANGDTKRYAHDGENLVSESDFKPASLPTRYHYDKINRLTQVDDRTGAASTYITWLETAGGYEKHIIDRGGAQRERVEICDALGRVTRVTHAGTPLAQYEYDGNDNRAFIIDGEGHRTEYQYDALNRLKTIRHPAAIQTETFDYDAVGNLLAHNDGRGPAVTQTYDSLDHLVTRTDGLGNVMRFTYDPEGLLLERVDPRGPAFKTIYEYNARRALAAVTDAHSSRWQFNRDGNLNLTTVLAPQNRETRYAFDRLDRMTTVTQVLGGATPRNLVTQYQYDQNSNRRQVTDPQGQITDTTYDRVDRPDEITYTTPRINGPQKYKFTYFPEGMVSSVTETTSFRNEAGAPVTRHWAYTYDNRNRLESTTDAENNRVAYTYDNNNQVRTLTYAGGVTAYAYDARRRLQTVTPSGAAPITYEWFPDGLPRNVNYGGGLGRAYTFDDAGRVKTIANNIGAGASELYEYNYDANGNRISQTRTRLAGGQTSADQRLYAYDALDRLTTDHRPTGVVSGLKGEYFDDAQFTPAQLKTTRVDATVNFNWPGTTAPAPGVNGNIYSARWTGQVQAVANEEFTFKVRGAGRARLWVDGRLLVDESARAQEPATPVESSGRLTLESGRKYDLRLEYADESGDGDIALKWSSATRPEEIIPAAQLSHQTTIGLAYAYDANGNRLAESGTDPGGATAGKTYTYDTLDRLSAISGSEAAAFSYDDNGNMTQATRNGVTWFYEYDVRDQLRRVTNGATELGLYDYDPARRRFNRRAGATALTSVYDGARVIAENNGPNGATQHRYEYGADLVRASLGAEGSQYYFHDALGSVSALSGGVTYSYDAWGTATRTGATASPVTFTGQFLDSETGLMALGNGERHYAPGLGRFIQQDSFSGVLESPASLNRYSYAHNNPVLHTDPSGNVIPLLVWGAIAVGAELGAWAAGSAWIEAGAQKARWDSEGVNTSGFSSLSYAFGEASGVNSAYKFGSGVDPLTNRQLGVGERALEGVGALASLAGLATGVSVKALAGGARAYRAADGVIAGARAAGTEISAVVSHSFKGAAAAAKITESADELV